MSTHRVYGVVHVAGVPAVRTVDVVSANCWNSDGLAAAILASATSDAGTGAWSAELDGNELVYVIARPVPPYAPLVLGPFRPVAL